MTSPRSIAVTLLALTAVGLTAAGCSSSQSSASGPDAPLPTIGLGSDLTSGAEPGVISGAADLRASGADDVDTIVMIGDSITQGSSAQLEDRFDGLGMTNVLIESQNSKRIAVSSGGNPSGVSIAESLTGERSVTDGSGDSDDAVDQEHANELWVVALGTNDVNQYSSPDEIAAAVNEMLAEVPEDSPLVWVDTYYRDSQENAEVINSIIRDRVERRGDAVVAPWSAFAVADGVLRSDGVHPTDAGADVFAFVVVDTVQAFLDR